MTRKKIKTQLQQALSRWSWFWGYKRGWINAQGRDVLLPYRDDPTFDGWRGDATTNGTAILGMRAARAAAQIAHNRGFGDMGDMSVKVDLIDFNAVVTIGNVTAFVSLAGAPTVETEAPQQVDVEEYINVARAA